MDPIVKLRHNIDALFGQGVSKHLPKNIEIFFSKRTGRIREVYHKQKLLCTLRIDGGLAISPYFAQILMKNKKFRENCVQIDNDSKPFVENGRSVFCGHIVWSGKNIRIHGEVPVLYRNKVIAVGKAILSSKMMSEQTIGVAVKVRNSLKSQLES
jgi:uncharacterized protein with predicted RNA binding PUA domain